VTNTRAIDPKFPMLTGMVRYFELPHGGNARPILNFINPPATNIDRNQLHACVYSAAS
jgi:hypothetical protein